MIRLNLPLVEEKINFVKSDWQTSWEQNWQRNQTRSAQRLKPSLDFRLFQHWLFGFQLRLHVCHGIGCRAKGVQALLQAVLQGSHGILGTQAPQEMGILQLPVAEGRQLSSRLVSEPEPAKAISPHWLGTGGQEKTSGLLERRDQLQIGSRRNVNGPPD